MDILIVGSGGREHALAWKLKQSPKVGKLYVAPGNGGTADIAENVPIGVMEFEKLAQFASEKQVGLVVIGPDDPLAGGLADVLRARGLRTWGPSKDAARIEASKAYAKELMKKAGVPTAESATCRSSGEARAYVARKGVPIVIKASGLALGKGVYMCQTKEEAERAIEDVMEKRIYGDAGSEVVIEEYLDGTEISIHTLSDGVDHILFPSSQDHKRAQDGDKGPNTGGMGVIAPVPWVKNEDMSHIDHTIVTPVFEQFKKEGILYQGILYPGLMMTTNGPKVLEFNARFGDPECQAYMRLLSSDLLDLLEASTDGSLTAIRNDVQWAGGYAVNIVLASGGYPGECKKGLPITGIEDAEAIHGVVVFHAGTARRDGVLVTNGGRVLGVSAVGSSLKDALTRAYEAADKIQFEGRYMRRDIGAKALH